MLAKQQGLNLEQETMYIAGGGGSLNVLFKPASFIMFGMNRELQEGAAGRE